MTSDRAYSAAMDPVAARAELERHAGTQFDKRVVGALIGVLERETQRAEDTLLRTWERPAGAGRSVHLASAQPSPSTRTIDG